MTEALDLIASLVLDTGQRWGDVAEPWQWDFARTVLDPTSPPNRWESRPRGGSKTTDTAAVAIALLTTVLPAGSECHAFARDLDQARRIRDQLAGFVLRTPGLARELKLDRHVVTARSGSTLTIESADAASAYGQLSHLTICDELCQWPATDNSRTLWEAISSGMGKVPGARLIVITTSGDPGSWSHMIYQAAEESERWTVQDVGGPLPWADPRFLDDQRHEIPPSAFERLHLNRWTAGEDRLSTLEDLEACITLAGPTGPEFGRSYVVTGDLGFTKDRSVVAVLHRELIRDEQGEYRGHRIALDNLKVWKGTRKSPVQHADVEAAIVEWCRLYRARAVVDPHEAVGMIQDLGRRGIDIEAYGFTSSSVGNLGLGLFNAIRSHRLAIWRDEELIDELLNVKLIEKTVGSYRLSHTASRHDDMAVCLALGVVALEKDLAGFGGPTILNAEDFRELMTDRARDELNATGGLPFQFAKPARPGMPYSGDWGLEAVEGVGLDDDERPRAGSVQRSPWAES